MYYFKSTTLLSIIRCLLSIHNYNFIYTILQFYWATMNISLTYTNILLNFSLYLWPTFYPYWAINKSIFVFWQLYVRYFSHLGKWHLKSNTNIYVIRYIRFLRKEQSIGNIFAQQKHVTFRQITFRSQKTANVRSVFLQMCKIAKSFLLSYFVECITSNVFNWTIS